MVDPDVIEGGAAPQRPWLRRVAAAAAVLALAGWLLHSRPEPGPDSPPPPTPPDHLIGAELTEDLGPVLVPSRPPTLVDTGEHTSVPVIGLPAAAKRYGVTGLGGQRFLVTASASQGVAEVYLVIDAVARLVATGDHAVPGADGSSVLVTQTAGTRRQVQRYGLDGSTLGDPVSLADDENLAFETVAGWVLASLDGAQLRDPNQPRQPGGYFTLYAATPTRLAYMPWGGGLVLAGLAPGGGYTSLEEIDVPAGSGVVAGAVLRADGRRLAVHTVVADASVHTVQVLNLENGGWSTLPGTPVRVVAGEDALAMAWSGDVLSVVAANGDAVLWRPGDRVAYAVPGQVTPRPR